MTEITLRPATIGDVDTIRACIRAAYAEAAAQIPDLPDVASGLEDEIARHQVVVAGVEDVVCGVVIFGRAGSDMMIFNLAVSPEAQGQGIARRLLDIVERAARREHVRTLRLTTHRLMVSTRAMYSHLGWHEVGRERNKVFFAKPV